MIGLLEQAPSMIGDVMDATAVTSPYPPSFDNNPLIFGWALFARLLVFSLSVATLIRIRANNIAERLPANHPVYHHRMVTVALLWAALCGSLSDVVTYLFWGEVSTGSTAIVLLLAQLLNALTLIPFLMALFTPLWLKWLCTMGVLNAAPTITLNGLVNDVRSTWLSASIPIRLLMYSAISSALVTVGKYMLWLEHGRF